MKGTTLISKGKRSSVSSLNSKPRCFSNTSQLFMGILINNLETLEVSFILDSSTLCAPYGSSACGACGIFAIFNFFPTSLIKVESHKHTVFFIPLNHLIAATSTSGILLQLNCFMLHLSNTTRKSSANFCCFSDVTLRISGAGGTSLRSSGTADNLLSVEFPLLKLWHVSIAGAFKSRYPAFLRASRARWSRQLFK